MPAIYKVKCDAVQFDAIVRGDKNFEVRKDDRAYQVADALILERLAGPGEPSGVDALIQKVFITFVLRGGQYGIEPGYVVLAISPERPHWIAFENSDAWIREDLLR